MTEFRNDDSQPMGIEKWAKLLAAISQ